MDFGDTGDAPFHVVTLTGLLGGCKEDVLCAAQCLTVGSYRLNAHASAVSAGTGCSREVFVACELSCP